MFQVYLFGSTMVRTPGRILGLDDLPGGKPRQLLEILALARGAVMTKPVLAEQLWAGRPPPSSIATLETYVAVLRRAVQPGVPGRDTIIRTAAGGYRLDTRAAPIDLDDFDETVAVAERVEPATALPLWQRAACMAARRVLTHEPHAEWAHEVREDYTRRGVRAAVRGARLALALDDPDLAVSLAEHATRHDPLAEDAWQVMIEGHGRAGRPGAAARSAAACLEVLARELGVYPSPLTRRLLGAALADPTASGPTASTRPALAVAAGG